MLFILLPLNVITSLLYGILQLLMIKQHMMVITYRLLGGLLLPPFTTAAVINSEADVSRNYVIVLVRSLA